jgi:hypothetical protein
MFLLLLQLGFQQEGDVANPAEGIATVYKSTGRGYDIDPPDEVFSKFLWVPAIPADYICTWGNDSWRFSALPIYEYRQITDGLGIALEIVGSLIVAAALMATWPLLLNTDRTVSWMAHVMWAQQQQEAHDTVRRGDEEPVCEAPVELCSLRARTAWLCFSGGLLVLVATLVTHVLFKIAGFPTYTKTIQEGQCMYLDRSHETQTYADFSQHGARVLAEGKPWANETIDPTPAQVTIDHHGLAAIQIPCGAALWEPGRGVTWLVRGPWASMCAGVRAHRITKIARTHSRRCTVLGTWSKEQPWGDAVGARLVIPFGESGTGDKCGIWPGYREFVKGHISVWYTDEDDWVFCEAYNQPEGVFRFDESTGQMEELALSFVTEQNPISGRQLGWYTNGHEVVLRQGLSPHGESSTLLYKTPSDFPAYFKEFHIRGGGLPSIIHPFAVVTAPAELRCITTLFVPNADRFQELQSPCSIVFAEIVTRDDLPADRAGVAIRIGTDSEVWCTVEVSFVNITLTSTVSVRRAEGATYTGLSQWRCLSVDARGYDCGPNVSWEPIPFGTLDDYTATQVTYQDTSCEKGESPSFNLSLTDPFDSLFGKNEWMTALYICLGIILGVVAIVIVFRIIRCACHKDDEGEKVEP